MNKTYLSSLNILISCAGKGQRFKDAGYTTCKPLIEINGITMIERLINSLKLPDCNFIFIIQKVDNDKDKFKNKLKKYVKNEQNIIILDHYTDGCAQTCLFAKKLINNDNPLLIINCDQIFDWNPSFFINHIMSSDSDGIVLTEKKNNPTYSYIKTDDNDVGLKLAEKEVISNNALIGVHYWKQGKYMIESTEYLINNNIKTNNEYYLSLTYNYLIRNGMKVTKYEFLNNEKYYVVGTPDELNHNIKYLK